MSGSANTVQAAPAPSGMRRIPIPVESYQHPSVPLASQRLLNVYVEQAPDDARSQTPLTSSHGLLTFQSVGTGPIRAMNDSMPGVIYLVSGTHAFRMHFLLTGLTIQDLGDVGTPDTGVIPAADTMITIAAGPNAAVFCVPPRAYTCGHGDTDPLNQIGGDFPGAATVCYHDGYFVYTAYENSSKWFIGRLLDPLAFDALDFVFADAFPNVIRRIMPLRTNLWVTGAGGIEVWYDAGNADFPYRRLSGGAIQSSVQSPRSLAVADNSLFWVNLACIVFRSNNYQPLRVSTHAIERTIFNAGGASQIVSSFAYSVGGHIFYCINFPTFSLVYDCATQKWHDRSSHDGTGRWRVDSVAEVGGTTLMGDSLSNAVFTPQLAAGAEDGVAISQSITLPPLYAGTRRAFCARLEIELESGSAALVGGTVNLEWSDDGGWNFTGGPRVMQSGATTGNRRQRVFTTRLGSFRERVFRISVAGNTTIYGVDADITAGAS